MTMITNSPLGIRRINALRGSILAARIARLAPVPLRLIVGYGFAEHGLAKLLLGPENFTGLLHAMGMPFPHFLAWLTISTEIIGGACVLAGALIPTSASRLRSCCQWPYSRCICSMGSLP
jgi:putative oxidoreductase